MIPDENDREFIQQSIFNELIKGIFAPKTKSRYITIINKLISDGTKGIIFGFTEIPMLIKQEDCIVPVFNTMMIHANAAVDFVLSK